MQSSDWSSGDEVKRHGRSGRERARATGSERGATAWRGQSCLGAVLFSSPRYCWPRFDATVTTWTWYSIYPWVRWAFRLLHRLRPSVKSEKNSTSTCCWPRANSVCARQSRNLETRAEWLLYIVKLVEVRRTSLTRLSILLLLSSPSFSLLYVDSSRESVFLWPATESSRSEIVYNTQCSLRSVCKMWLHCATCNFTSPL